MNSMLGDCRRRRSRGHRSRGCRRRRLGRVVCCTTKGGQWFHFERKRRCFLNLFRWLFPPPLTRLTSGSVGRLTRRPAGHHAQRLSDRLAHSLAGDWRADQPANRAACLRACLPAGRPAGPPSGQLYSAVRRQVNSLQPKEKRKETKTLSARLINPL